MQDYKVMRAMTGKAASCPDSEGRGADVEHGPEAHPRLPARRPLSPIGYKAAPLWRAFPASSPGGTARYVNEAATCSHSWRTEDGAERLAGSRPRHLVGRKLC